LPWRKPSNLCMCTLWRHRGLQRARLLYASFWRAKDIEAREITNVKAQ
jgi:hypothetical protein